MKKFRSFLIVVFSSTCSSHGIATENFVLACLNVDGTISVAKAASQLIKVNQVVTSVVEKTGPQDSSIASIVAPEKMGWVNDGAAIDFSAAARDVLGIDLSDPKFDIQTLEALLNTELPKAAERIRALKVDQPGLHMFLWATLTEIVTYLRIHYSVKVGNNGIAAQLINGQIISRETTPLDNLLRDPIVAEGYFPLSWRMRGDLFAKDWVAPDGVDMTTDTVYGSDLIVIQDDGTRIKGKGLARFNAFKWVILNESGEIQVFETGFRTTKAVYIKRDRVAVSEDEMRQLWQREKRQVEAYVSKIVAITSAIDSQMRTALAARPKLFADYQALVESLTQTKSAEVAMKGARDIGAYMEIAELNTTLSAEYNTLGEFHWKLRALITFEEKAQERIASNPRQGIEKAEQ